MSISTHSLRNYSHTSLGTNSSIAICNVMILLVATLVTQDR